MNKQKWVLIFFLFSVPSVFGFTRGGVDRYELSLGGDVPFHIGMQGRYNWNTNFYTKAGAGFAMELFMNTHQKLLNSFGFSEHNRLLTSSLVNSVVFDLRMGWSVNIYEGPYFELGYNLMIWGKGEVEGRELQRAINPQNNLSGSAVYQVNILNHGPAAHVGYRFILIDKLTLNMDFGIYKPVFSETDLSYGSDISVSAGESEQVNELVVRELWFMFFGLWFGLSF